MNTEKVQRLCFLDTETTSLRPDRRAWEVAWIVRDLVANVQDEPVRRFVERTELDLGNADPFALAIGRFYQRHPDFEAVDGDQDLCDEWEMLVEVEQATRGAVVIGCNPAFDGPFGVLETRMRAHGIAPSWHYRPVDAGSIALGYLAGKHTHVFPVDLVPSAALPALPWNSDELSRLLGVEPAPPELRHTAAGDAIWAMRLFDAATAGAYALRVPDAR